MPSTNLRLFLVRHAQSEANLEKSVNVRLPDQKINLSSDGHRQAIEMAEYLARHIQALAKPPKSVRILCSPYNRTRQTAGAIEERFAAAGISFDKREAIELREISFGLFDGILDEDLPARFPVEYEHYEKHKRFEGEFFAPMPLGESRVQVADRVKNVFGTILRDADPNRENPISDFVIVSHGVTIRCFRMQWMHHPWEWYEAESNPKNCSIQLIETVDGRYIDRPLFAGFDSPRTEQTRREEGVVG